MKTCNEDHVPKVIGRIGSKYQNLKEKSFVFLDMKLSGKVFGLEENGIKCLLFSVA